MGRQSEGACWERMGPVGRVGFAQGEPVAGCVDGLDTNCTLSAPRPRALPTADRYALRPLDPAIQLLRSRRSLFTILKCRRLGRSPARRQRRRQPRECAKGARRRSERGARQRLSRLHVLRLLRLFAANAFKEVGAHSTRRSSCYPAPRMQGEPQTHYGQRRGSQDAGTDARR